MATAIKTDPESAIAQLDPQLRLDPAHELAAAGARSVEREPQLAAVAVATLGVMTEAAPGDQLRLQADQLASHLHLRLREVDRREASLNAQLADQENGVRSARLWFRERQQENMERAAELDRREREIELREQVQAQAERELAESRRLSAFEVRRQTDALNARLRELDLREQTVINDEAENAAVGAAMAQRAATQQQIEDRYRADSQRFNRQVGVLLSLIQVFLHGAPPADADEVIVPPEYSEPAQAEALIECFAATINGLHSRQRNLNEAEALLADGQAELDEARRQLAADRLAWDEHCAEQRLALERTRADAERELERHGQSLLARDEERSQSLARQFAGRQAELNEQSARNEARASDLERRQIELERERLQLQHDRRAYEREIRRLLGELRR
jgi:hypothetical protein